jgi:hypothetical protein
MVIFDPGLNEKKPKHAKLLYFAGFANRAAAVRGKSLRKKSFEVGLGFNNAQCHNV